MHCNIINTPTLYRAFPIGKGEYQYGPIGILAWLAYEDAMLVTTSPRMNQWVTLHVEHMQAVIVK